MRLAAVLCLLVPLLATCAPAPNNAGVAPTQWIRVSVPNARCLALQITASGAIETTCTLDGQQLLVLVPAGTCQRPCVVEVDTHPAPPVSSATRIP